MTKLDIAISSIRDSIEINDDELDSFKKIIKSLNEKTNMLMMQTGKISDRLLLFILILININKKERIIDNFEENIIKLIKKVVPLFQNGSHLDNQLILSSIIVENETSEIKDNREPTKNIKEEKSEQEMTLFLDEIIDIINKLSNTVSEL